MKRLLLWFALSLVLASVALAQANLESVLKKMDTTADSFRTAQASFAWDQYTKVVDDHSEQDGTIYFRKGGKGTEMYADVVDKKTGQTQKSVLFSEGKVRLYETKVDRVTVYDSGKNKAEFESFLLLGFGGRGHDLLKSYDVKFGGEETVEGIKSARLDLVPKLKKTQKMFDRIQLWIDEARGVSVQQKFEESSGDYRLAKYANIKLNEKIADDTFKLKTGPHTQTVTPQGL